VHTDIVSGDEKTTSIDPKEKKKWEIKAKKVMYILSIIVEDEFLYRIKDCKMPNEAWSILETLFTKKNEAKLQQLENEIMSIEQGDMMLSQCFTNIKYLCDEIQKVDAENAINKARMQQIIFRGFGPKYNGLVTTTQVGQLNPL